MPEYQAANCKNFDGADVTEIGELTEIRIVCVTENCVDRKRCNGKVIEPIKEVHFEPITT